MPLIHMKLTASSPMVTTTSTSVKSGLASVHQRLPLKRTNGQRCFNSSESRLTSRQQIGSSSSSLPFPPISVSSSSVNGEDSLSSSLDVGASGIHIVGRLTQIKDYIAQTSAMINRLMSSTSMHGRGEGVSKSSMFIYVFNRRRVFNGGLVVYDYC